MPSISRDPWGVEATYVDVAGREHPTSDETREALHRAMGASEDGEAAAGAFADVAVIPPSPTIAPSRGRPCRTSPATRRWPSARGKTGGAGPARFAGPRTRRWRSSVPYSH